VSIARNARSDGLARSITGCPATSDLSAVAVTVSANEP
jgi:hypothetical protein